MGLELPPENKSQKEDQDKLPNEDVPRKSLLEFDDEPPKRSLLGLDDDELVTAGTVEERPPDDPEKLPPDPLLDMAKEMVRETIDEEMALFEVLVVTDVANLRRHTKPASELAGAKARVAVVTDPANPLAADKLMVQWAQAGKPVVTWCSMTDQGRRVAREVASTLNPYLQAAANADDAAAARVRHIVKDPRDWQPLVDPFNGLVDGARITVPPAPRRSSSGGNGKSAAARDDDYSATSLRNAEKLLLAHPDRLLVVTDSQDALSDLYVLGENGVWQRGDVTLREWMGEMADELKIKAVIHDQLDGRELSAVLQRIRRLAEPETLKPIREQAATALRRLINRGDLQPGDVTTCLNTDLDADLRYLGALNGVVDLHTGKRLPPAEGRLHLVTWQTPVAFDPMVIHKDVDRLFGHLPVELRIWWWAVLGYHLLGSPSRRFYVVEGPKGGGKSTLANALEAVLGPYASRPQDTALEAPRASAGLSPEIEKLTSPRRLALFVELTIIKVSSPQVKRFCGDDAQTLRKPYKDEITARLTATMLLFCNPGSVPHLRLQDEAMADRLCVLPYPSIPESDRDPLFTRRVQTDEGFKRAFLARLVASAAAQEPGVAPEEPPEVAAATAERVRDDMGELGAFARRLVRDVDATLPFAEVWDAWCQYNEENPTEAQAAGGITKRRLSGALRNFVPRLPVARQFRVDGQRVRGFRGWRLLSPEEMENEAGAEQALSNLQRAVRGLTKDQIEKAIPLLKKLAEGQIIEYDGSEYITVPGYSYMESERKPSTAFHQAYERALLARKAGRAGPISNIEADVALMLAEKYLVQADERLGGLATADDLASEAARLMTDAMSTASEEFTPEAKLITDELERIILWLSKGHNYSPRSETDPTR